jgi:hypothetical protein
MLRERRLIDEDMVRREEKRMIQAEEDKQKYLMFY